MTEAAHANFDEAPIDAADDASDHFAQFGHVNAVLLDHDGNRWVLHVVFEDEDDLEQKLPHVFKDYPVRFSVGSFRALTR